MNREKRKLIKNAVYFLSNALDLINRCISEEEDSLDNMPENLQYSEKCCAMEDAISVMGLCAGKIEKVSDDLCELIEE